MVISLLAEEEPVSNPDPSLLAAIAIVERPHLCLVRGGKVALELGFGDLGAGIEATAHYNRRSADINRHAVSVGSPIRRLLEELNRPLLHLQSLRLNLGSMIQMMMVVIMMIMMVMMIHELALLPPHRFDPLYGLMG
jgi:hypothetical protein